MRRSLLGAAIAATLAGAVALGGSPPAFAADTGSITGQLTGSEGAPVADVPVYIYEDDPWEIAGSTITNADGSYTVEGLPPGTYVVEFEPLGRPWQYYDNATSPSDADLVTVTAGQATVVDEDLIPVGWLTGRLVRPDGSPLAYRPVSAATADGSNSTWAMTDEDGRYRLGAVPGSYVVSFEPIDGSWQRQYVPGRLTEDGATRFAVTTGAETVADDTSLATGSLTGRLTTAEGAPVANASLGVAVADGGLSTGIYASTDADGEFSVPEVLVGGYTVGFYADPRQQWYDGAIRIEDADTVTIAAGQETRIVESWVGTGSVAVSAVDSVTGAAIAAFCVGGECTTGGTVTLTDLPAGLHELWLSTEDGSYFGRSANVRARADRTVAVTIKLRPAGRITTTVVDRATGEPVEGVCARAYKPKQVALSDGYGECSDAQGRLNIGQLTGGTYRIFVDPVGAPTYGRQWLGAAGGTGDEREAAALTVTVGNVATAQQVLLDPAGSIQGRITDAVTGNPLSAGVTLLTSSPGAGVGDVTADAQGRYRMDRLGPYAWPVHFIEWGYAQQWSGNKPSRYTATPVTVASGATTAYDIALQRGTEVRGTVTLDGSPPDWGRLQVHSTDTGDHAGVADFEGDGPYSMRVLGDQRVTFEYYLGRGDETYHETRVPLPPATPGGPVRYAVRVPSSGTLTVDIAGTTSG